MSTRNKILTVGAVLLVVGAALRFGLPEIFAVAKPHVSVAAEPLFTIGGFEITNSLLVTVLVSLFLVVVSMRATSGLRAGNAAALGAPRGLQNFMELVVETLYNTFESVNARYVARFFTLVATIFFFVVVSNWSGLLPLAGFGVCYDPAAHGEAAYASTESLGANGAESGAAAEKAHGNTCPTNTIFHPIWRAPSTDLNMTLMLALVSFLMTEFWGFRVNGFRYLGRFFVNPFKKGFIQALVGLIELISEFARLISFTFRLFGNIFAGEVVLLVMSFLFPYLLGLPFYGFEVFVGFIQAFVFAMLTMAFMDMATASHDEHGDGEHAAAH